MPSKKYYRSRLPDDLLQIVGDYAGDEMFKLEFTHSKKRRFLSFIRLKQRHPKLYYPKSGGILTAESWFPVRLGNFKSLLELLTREMSLVHLRVFRESLLCIHKLLSEVHDYTLYPKFIN